MLRNIALLILFTSMLPSCIPPSGQNNLVQEFYMDGSLKSTSEVKNGMRNGITKNFDEKGRLLSTCEYVDDKRNGWLVNYNPEIGKVITKVMFRDDLQDGPLVMNYQEGMLFRESNYTNGRVNGLVKTYWPNGKLKAQVHFKMGMPGNDLKEYDKEGKEIVQPQLIIEKATTQKNSIKIYLSDHSTDFEVYVSELKDDMYFLENTGRLRVENGVCLFDYVMVKQRASNRGFSIVVKAKTKLSNTLILQKWVKI